MPVSKLIQEKLNSDHLNLNTTHRFTTDHGLVAMMRNRRYMRSMMGPALIALMDAPNPPLLKDLLGAKDKMLAINSTNMTLAYHLSIHALRRGIAACIGKHLHLCLPTREEQPLRKRKHRNLSCRNVMTQATERHSFPGARGEGGRARLSSALAQSLTSAIISSAHLAVVMVCSRALGRRIPGTREAHHVAGHGVEARAKS